MINSLFKPTVHNSRFNTSCTFLVLLAVFSTLGTSITLTSASPQEDLTDEIIVKGKTLTGKILRLDSSGIQFQTIYGKGTLVINYSDIERIASLMLFHFIKENGEEFRGVIYGKTEQHLLVGITRELVQQLAFNDIRIGIPEFEFNRSFLTRLRYRYRYWSGSIDLFLSTEQGGVDKREIEFGLKANRRKKPTRFLFSFNYAYEIQRSSDTPEVKTTDEFTAFFLGEHDIFSSFFIFTLPAAERDVPRGVEKRIYPAAGVGYRFTETATSLLQAQGGIAYVYEEFTDFDDNDYLAAHLGVEARYKFQRDIVLSGRLYYYPSFSGPADDWLFRGDLELTIPLYEFIAMKFRVTNVNDDNPAPDVGDNKFTALMGLSLTF